MNRLTLKIIPVMAVAVIWLAFAVSWINDINGPASAQSQDPNATPVITNHSAAFDSLFEWPGRANVTAFPQVGNPGYPRWQYFDTDTIVLPKKASDDLVITSIFLGLPAEATHQLRLVRLIDGDPAQRQILKKTQISDTAGRVLSSEGEGWKFYSTDSVQIEGWDSATGDPVTIGECAISVFGRYYAVPSS